MKLKLTKEFLLACHEAKRIIEHMPPLPKGMKPRHLHVMETILDLSKTQDIVRVSDISDALNVTKPSITKLINELVALGMVEKKQQEKDRRVFTLSLTQKGAGTFARYGTGFHTLVNERLGNISPEDMRTAIRVIHEVAQVMEPAEEKFEKMNR